MAQDSIMRYLKERGIKTTPSDPKVVEEYERSMREETIPGIIKDQREQARLVAEMRRKVLF